MRAAALRRALAGTAVIAALVSATVPAAADTAPATPGPATAVGGPELAGHDVVVHPAPGVAPLPTDITAHSWLVADLDTGEVLAAKNPHGRYLPASTLKILTAVTLIPRLDADASVRPTHDDIAVDGSKVGLVEQLTYTVSSLFTDMLVVSGNDAANTLATAAGGSARTVELMNDEAARLQAFDTHAGTPSGLDAPGETSSAYDLALIARAGLQMPAFRRYVATVQSYVPAPGGKQFQIYTHNRLLTTYRGAIGVKNGYTVAAQATFVGAAVRDGHTLVVTCMHAAPDVWRDAAKLLDWGFAADGVVRPVGRLVPPSPGTPLVRAAAADATAGHAPPHAVTAAATEAGGGPVLPWVLLGLSTVTAAVVLRHSRRRRRQPSRTLPPL